MCKKEKLIDVSQIGFREGYRTSDHIFSLKTLLNKYALERETQWKTVCLFYGLKKAYDSVWHKGLFSQLENLSMRGKVLKIIKDMYENSKCAVKIQNKITIFSLSNRGVRQGCPLSSILLSIYINDLAFDLDNSKTSKRYLYFLLDEC